MFLLPPVNCLLKLRWRGCVRSHPEHGMETSPLNRLPEINYLGESPQRWFYIPSSGDSQSFHWGSLGIHWNKIHTFVVTAPSAGAVLRSGRERLGQRFSPFQSLATGLRHLPNVEFTLRRRTRADPIFDFHWGSSGIKTSFLLPSLRLEKIWTEVSLIHWN